MSHDLLREQESIRILGGLRADQRVAAFLLNHSARYRNLGYASDMLYCV
ncbi:MAG: hypothetical protein V3U76_02885 [Granulosicoccus sp.]